MNTALSHAIDLANGQTKLAEELTKLCGETVYQSYINYWLNHAKKGVPPKYCNAIEQITNGEVRAADLCRDGARIFATPSSSKRRIAHKARKVLGCNPHDVGKVNGANV